MEEQRFTSHEQLIQHIEFLFKNNVNIVRAKNHDYSSSVDAFWNFRLCEVFGLCKAEVAIMARLLDKIGRTANLINFRPAVQDETIHDTIADAINYLAILHAYLSEESAAQLKPCNSQYVAERGYGEGI